MHGILVIALLAGHAAAQTVAGRYTETVSELDRITQERRDRLAENPEGKTPQELSAFVPEINFIEFVNDASDQAPEETLRVIAWNMERGRHWRDGVKLIQEHPALRNPDVVFLGEMDFGMARSRNAHTTRQMAAALGMNYAYGVEFLELTGGEEQERIDYPGDNDYGYHGNAILTKFPMRNVRMVRFPGIDKWYADYQQRLGGRMALFAEVDLNGTTVTLVSTHLESGLGDDAARLRESRLILAELARSASDNPAILGGDLNAAPTRDAIRVLVEAGLEIEAVNDLKTPTLQRDDDGGVRLYGWHIDYLALRGLAVVESENSPAVVPAVYPPTPDGAMLGDHAVVVALIQTPL